MIEIKQKGCKVIVKVQGCHPIGQWWYDFSSSYHHESEAQLVCENLDRNLDETIRKIKQDAFDEGYRRGRGHRQKIGWFSRWFKADVS